MTEKMEIALYEEKPREDVYRVNYYYRPGKIANAEKKNYDRLS